MTEDIQYITEEQYEEFLDAIPQLHLQLMSHEDVRLMYQVMYEGALRVSEIVKGDSSPGLTPNDLDIQNKRIILRFAKGGWEACKCVTKEYMTFEEAKQLKGKKKATFNFMTKQFVLKTPKDDCKKCNGKGKFRVKEFAWVSPETFDKLAKLTSTKKKDERLFHTDRRQVWAWTKRLGDLANIKLVHKKKDTTNFFPHAIRHTRAVKLAETMKINAVSTKLRHKSLQPTKTYVDLADNDVQAKEFNNVS